jgi:hypothetical protein
MSQEEDLCKYAEILFCRHEHVTAKSNDGGAYGDYRENGIIYDKNFSANVYLCRSVVFRAR